ncbi:MGMT family protein [Nonomuraea sp. NPDC049152]|uniref:MGMT family protein n=1 Tax=Nonomuraea sp. NPDC049152 TaxID=3154350 RepID=UPI0033D321E2
MVTPYGERVLDLVERIPPGQVMSYGDIAEYLEEGGPRQVGTVMSTWGGAVPWWRVVHADGTAAPGLVDRALPHWREEGTPLRGERVDMRSARWLPSGDFQQPTDLA